MSKLTSAQIYVESLLLGPKAFAAEMPFADESCPITGLLQRFGKSHFIERKVAENLGTLQLLVGPVGAAWKPVGQPEARGIFSGENAGASGRTDGTRGIGLGKPHTAGGEPIEIGGFVKGAAVTTEVASAEVIGEDENKIGFGGRLALDYPDQQKKREDDSSKH